MLLTVTEILNLAEHLVKSRKILNVPHLITTQENTALINNLIPREGREIYVKKLQYFCKEEGEDQENIRQLTKTQTDFLKKMQWIKLGDISLVQNQSMEYVHNVRDSVTSGGKVMISIFLEFLWNAEFQTRWLLDQENTSTQKRQISVIAVYNANLKMLTQTRFRQICLQYCLFLQLKEHLRSIHFPDDAAVKTEATEGN